MKRSYIRRGITPMNRIRMKAGSASKRKADAEWARKVKERDGYICQRCEKYGAHAHHVATRKRRPDLRYDVDNGKTLCFECHDWVHDHPIEAAEAGLLSTESYETRLTR